MFRITPTLFIGLGGTGYKVLSRLRRQLTVYYGDLNLYCPMFDFIFIDTDENNLKGDSNGINTTVDNINTYLDVHKDIDWFPKDNLVNFPDGFGHIDGANQIRPFGRLAFFVNYREIKDKIQHSLIKIKNINASAILQSSPRLIQKDTALTARVDCAGSSVVIVASIAGGTGCGMLIDTLALLKNELRGNQTQMT